MRFDIVWLLVFAPLLRVISEERYKTYILYAQYCDNSIAQYVGCNLDVSQRVLAVMYPQKSPICCSFVPLATPATHCNPCTYFCSFASTHCLVDCASVIPPQQKWRETTKKSGRVIEGVLLANIHTHTESARRILYKLHSIIH